MPEPVTTKTPYSASASAIHPCSSRYLAMVLKCSASTMFARCITPSWVTYAPGIPLASTAAACKTLRAVSHGRVRLSSSFTKSCLLPTDQDRASFVSTHRLADSKEIALVVSEPGGPLANAPFARVVPGDLSDAVDRPQARKVIFLEHHSTRSQPLHGRLNVFDLPR